MMQNVWMEWLLVAIGVAFLVLMGALCLLLLTKMWKNEINLSSLLNEENGEASMSRFQLLIFTLVVAVGVFLFIVNHLVLPDIPNSVLVLLGISASTYAAGKGISFSRPEGIVRHDSAEEPTAPEATPPAAAPPQ
jgi:hypothetical protein